MMYYIDKVNTWSPANLKCKEVQRYVNEFQQTLIPDEEASNELVKEIRQKVKQLNAEFPRTKRLTVNKNGNFVACFNEERKLDDQYVFTFLINAVRRTYKKGGVE